MCPLFRDPASQRAFDSQGFAVVPFLDLDEVDHLRALWERVRPPEVRGIYSNVANGAVEDNAEIDREITDSFATATDRTFADGRIAGASFLVKGTGKDSDSKLHQDYNNVDERLGHSATIWVPLVDVDESNGALQVLPGSHRLVDSTRSLTLPSVYLDFDEQIEERLVALPVRAGTAVVYAHALFHGSKPNHSDEIRVAAVAGILPLGLEHLHYWQRPGAPADEVEVLGVNRHFFMSGLGELASGRVPGGVRRLGTQQRRTRLYDRDEVLSALPPLP